MKCGKYRWISLVVAGMLLLTGCGGSKVEESLPGEESLSASEVSSSEQVKASATASSAAQEKKIPMSVGFTLSYRGEAAEAGAQFVDGQPLQLWRKENSAEKDEKWQCLYIFDDSGYGTVKLNNFPIGYKGNMFYTQEGYGLVYNKNELSRIEADGQVTYDTFVESGIWDICQLADGQIIMIVVNVEGQVRLALLHPDTGEYTLYDTIELTKDKRQYIAPYGEGLALLNGKGFWEVDLETGEWISIMPMSEYDYTLEYTVKDFRIVGGGCAELLFLDGVEVLQPVDAAKYRTVLTLSTLYESTWLKRLIAQFNCTNYEYFVQTKLWTKEDSEGNTVEREEFIEQVAEEIRKGAGPDILTAGLVENPLLFMEENRLVDLSPYMETSGIYEEDFFYAAFDSWRKGEAIYGANILMGLSGLKINSEFLPEGEVPDIESFVEQLLNNSGNWEFAAGWDSEDILDYFLSCSDSFCGMVDWEEGVCDFEVSLFENMLEVAKLYRYDEDIELPILASLASGAWYQYENAEDLELKQQIYLGYFFDNGNRAKATTNYMLSINSNSPNKEGAWEFIRLALSEEYQSQKKFLDRMVPVSRFAFDNVAQQELSEGAMVQTPFENRYINTYKAEVWDGKLNYEEYEKMYNLIQDDIDGIRNMAEGAGCAPLRGALVMDLILEEARLYFDGDKSIDDVSVSVQKKVQAFLDTYCAEK